LKSEVEKRARFDLIRYAQVWEDADLLLEALDIQPGRVVLSIASAGDNAFALLTRGPRRVCAVDLSPAQIACCALRREMYLRLNWREHLTFGGVVSDHGGADDRLSLYRKRLRPALPAETREFWDARPDILRDGFMAQGKFERYFALFRRRVLPLIHGKRTVDALLAPKSREEREDFYARIWDNRRWRALFHLFFSRRMMGILGRDMEFFRYVEGSVAERILTRARHAMTELDTSQNPYLQYILRGRYDSVYPLALRPEHYLTIRANIGALDLRRESVESFAAACTEPIDAFNLSDIFEYMTEEGANAVFASLLAASAPGAKLAYWNMLVPRACSPELRRRYHVRTDEARNIELLLRDKAFFYSRFTVDTRCQTS
jgi:S-adenosylmethionine-diacylglycerol 3-amino-3-carboxypropyl transferase